MVSDTLRLIQQAEPIMNETASRFMYKTCPICSERLLVRINGTFVYKWISKHFTSHHHEWMHVVVNLR
ncbi:hypothetical protein K501DRAFT_28088 [Backusella circina FSU 941]|nr:hypothetical protein K501DRAFT_28088 [Backusella circina FSU 941]